MAQQNAIVPQEQQQQEEQEEEQSGIIKLNILVLGGTGLIGTEFLKIAADSAHITVLHVLARRELPIELQSDKINMIVEPDITKWAEIVRGIPRVDTVFSALGTTKSISKGWKGVNAIDHDFVLELAGVAKESGVQNFMVVTSFNQESLYRVLPYFKIKKQVEMDLAALEFDQLHIYRPGPLIGRRSHLNQHPSCSSRLSSAIARTLQHVPNVNTFVGAPISAEAVAINVLYTCETINSAANGSVNKIGSGDMIWMVEALRQADQ